MSAEGQGKVFPPKCQPPNVAAEKPADGDGVKMRKELGLLEGTAIILGIIMGSGMQIKTTILTS